MTENGILILSLGIILAIVQFLYRVWDKKDNKQIIKAIADGVSSFDKHIERTKRTYGIVRDMQKQHDIRDDDGRPMWFMPKEIMETQRELVKLTSIVANTQREMIKLVEKIEAKIDHHQEQCQFQFNTLDKKIIKK